MRKYCAVRSASHCACAIVRCQVRLQATLGEQRATSRTSHRGSQHPLAEKNPAARNIMVSEHVHARPNTNATLTAETIQKRAQRALALQLKKDLLWEGAVIDEASHDVAKHFMSLRTNVKYRNSRKLLIVGGKEFIRELSEQGHSPQHLLIPRGAEAPAWADPNRSSIVQSDRRVTDEVVPGTDGYVGDFEMPPPPPVESLIANKLKFDRVLVLDNVEDPGTLGSMLRSAAGFQYDCVLLVNHCADLYDTEVVRAARGAHFQTTVPFYQLREEDGDDSMGMINHIVQRNQLMPLCFTPHPVDDSTFGVNQSDGSNIKPERQGGTAKLQTVEKLSTFCLEKFSSPQPPGYVLFAGPDHTLTMKQRITRKVAAPLTQLKLDALESTSPSDLLVSLSCVMYALRPAGDWDYLPPSSAHSASTPALQNRSKVSIGPDRPLPVNERSISLDEDDQVRKADMYHRNRMERRINRRTVSDYDHWMANESKRIANEAMEEERSLTRPWEEKASHSRVQPNPSIPDIINDYKRNLDREELREEYEDVGKFVRPQNYESRVKTAQRNRV